MASEWNNQNIIFAIKVCKKWRKVTLVNFCDVLFIYVYRLKDYWNFLNKYVHSLTSNFCGVNKTLLSFHVPTLTHRINSGFKFRINDSVPHFFKIGGIRIRQRLIEVKKKHYLFLIKLILFRTDVFSAYFYSHRSGSRFSTQLNTDFSDIRYI